MIEIFSILSLLFVKHFIADFVLQFDYMVQEKGYYGKAGGIHHSFIHGFGTFLIFGWFFHPIAFWAGIADFLIHYHVDWAKMKLNHDKGYTPADREFWFWLGLDQMLHSLTYVILVFWAYTYF